MPRFFLPPRRNTFPWRRGMTHLYRGGFLTAPKHLINMYLNISTLSYLFPNSFPSL